MSKIEFWKERFAEYINQGKGNTYARETAIVDTFDYEMAQLS